MRTANPALNENVFRAEYGASTTMTLEGTVWKTGVLLAILMVGAAVTWAQVVTRAEAGGELLITGGLARLYAIGGSVVALGLGFFLMFRPALAGYVAPCYALAEGVALGAISAIFESNFGQGIVLQAVGLTFGTLASLLFAYSTRVIRATENFKLGVVAATGGICLVYVVSMVLNLFGVRVPFLHDGGPIGIAVSGVIVVIAALNLVLDFDFIENGVRKGAPKSMEWYGAYGLVVTLAWLYIEILRLLSKLRDR